MNPRRSARSMRDPKEWHALLRRMEQAIADTRSLARTIGAHSAEHALDSDFARPWVEMLGEVGRAAAAADPSALLAVRRRLEAFSEELRTTDRSSEWPVYGAMIINLRNIVDSMDEVAAANPILGRPLRIQIPPGPGAAVR